MKFEFDHPIVDYNVDECEEILERTKILFITVNEAEKEGFLKYLLPIPKIDAVIKVTHLDHTYHIGRLGYFLVAHVQSRMGSVSERAALLTTYKALEFINPKALIAVGVAFGIDPHKQHLGDVLVSEKIINYEIARVNNDNDITPRGSQPLSGSILFDRFTNTLNWHHRLTYKRNANLYKGPILSGEKLIDNPRFRDKLKKEFPKAIGGEMEGTGVSVACYEKNIPEWIVVKAICDWADGNKHKRSQPKAANSAMSLVFHVVSSPNTFKELKFSPIDEKVVLEENDRYTFNASVGTPLWILNSLRSRALTMLVRDMEMNNERGYQENIYKAVKADLKNYFVEISKLPTLYNGSKGLQKLFDEFIILFEEWHAVRELNDSAVQLRESAIKKLKRKRKDISRLIGKSQKRIKPFIGAIDTIFLLNAQKELIKEYPEMFPNLSKAIKRIEKKRYMKG